MIYVAIVGFGAGVSVVDHHWSGTSGPIVFFGATLIDMHYFGGSSFKPGYLR